VNHHGGGIGGGHYTSFVRRGDQWWLCDDYSIYKATEDQVLSSEAYLLFYERE
jgi:ubiquitin carboxyl-terminal hydrolase 4/11/15